MSSKKDIENKGILAFFRRFFRTKTVFRQVTTQRDLLRCHNLLVVEYKAKGYVESSSNRSLKTRVTDQYKRAAVFGAFERAWWGKQTAIGTIAVAEDSKDGLPMDEVFGDVLDEMRYGKSWWRVSIVPIRRRYDIKVQAGVELRTNKRIRPPRGGRLAEMGAFASREKRDRAIFITLMSRAYLKCITLGVWNIVITVNPCHDGFYRRIGFKHLNGGEPRDYQKVKAPAVGMMINVNDGLKGSFISKNLDPMWMQKYM